MRGTIIILNYDGGRIRIELNHANILQELRWAVGGPFEVIPGFDYYNGIECVAFCNEEGKLKGLPLNYNGTKAWRAALKIKEQSTTDNLAGNIAIVYGDKEFMEAI